MKFLSRLNPANHLYIKLFLWFWIATVIMMSGSIWTIKLLNDEVRFGPMRQADVIELNNYTQILQAALERRGAGTEKLDRILLQVSKRNQIDLILVESYQHITASCENKRRCFFNNESRCISYKYRYWFRDFCGS